MTKMITGLIGGMLYPLFSIIFLVIDLLQGVFYGLAGIGDIQFRNNSFGSSNYVNITATDGGDGGEKTTGLIYYLLTSDLIKNLFISILILAVFLILIFTAMAFIKNAYASKQKSWQEIVGNAFKGLANFIFIPVCCLLGIWLSNILLVAINAATSTGGSVDLSRKLFICCAYDANEFRAGTRDPITSQEEATDLQNWAGKNGVTVTVQVNQDAEYYATIVDQVFAEGTVSIHWWKAVEEYYSLFNFNYVVLIVGGVFMLYVLVSLAYAMIKRMFVLLMLYVISPAICAMYPLDEGSAVGNWKKEFIKYTISAYGAVAGLNLFFSILPIVQNINIISTSNSVTGVLLNDILQLLIMVSGLFVVKEFMGTLSGWIGGDNALATGSSLRSSTKKGIADNYKKVPGGIGNTVGVFSKAKGAHDAGGSFFKSLGGQAWDSVKKSSGIKDIQEKSSKSYQEGESRVFDNVKKQNIRRISAMYDVNPTQALRDAQVAGVEKDIAEVVAKRENAERIRASRGTNGIVPVMTGEQVLEDKKKAKAESDARKEFVQATKTSRDARNEANARLTATPGEFDSIGGLGFVQDAINARQNIDIQEGMSDAQKRLVIELNSIIEKLRETDAQVKATGDKYVEAAKAVSDINTGLADKNNPAYQVGGVGPASKDNIANAMHNFLETVMDPASALADTFGQINLAFNEGVQSLQRFSSATVAHTDAAMRNAATIDEGTDVIKQATKKK